MKRIGIVGLSLVATFAFSAMAASSALAGLYITCVKAAKVGKVYSGLYTNNNCSTMSATKEGKYEAGSPKFPVKATGTTKEAVLSSAAGDIKCKKSKGTGSLLSATKDLEETIFETCILSLTNGKCTNLAGFTGSYSGKITAVSLTTLIDHGEKGPSGGEPAEGEVWNAFAPDPESALYPYQAVYICEPGVEFRTSGTTSAVATPVLGKPSPKGTLTFGAGKGEQDLVTEFSENGGETWESTGPNVETVTASIKLGEKVELTDTP